MRKHHQLNAASLAPYPFTYLENKCNMDASIFVYSSYVVIAILNNTLNIVDFSHIVQAHLLCFPLTELWITRLIAIVQIEHAN